MDVLKVVVLLGLSALMASAAQGRGLEALSDFQGIRYNEQGRPVGLPLGGIGAGCVEISSQGTLIEFANVNNWVARIPSVPGTGLWLTYTVDGQTQVFALENRKVEFEGNFPFAKLRYPGLPVDVTLWAWSPLILHDVRHSSYPVAIFDAEIRNTGSKPAEVGLVLSYGTQYTEWLQKITTSHIDMTRDTGFHQWEALREGAKSHAIYLGVDSTSESFSGKSASGVSFSTKANVDVEGLTERIQATRAALEKTYLRNYDLTPLDISASCNRSYLNAPFGIKDRDFAGMQPGTRDVYNIPFTVVDDVASGGKSMVIAGPVDTAKSVTMTIGSKADCLFVLGNCAGWTGDGTAEYAIHYADGSEQVAPLRVGLEINEFWGGEARYTPGYTTGTSTDGNGWIARVLGVLVDHPDREIATLEVRKTGSISPIVFAVTVGKLASTPLVEGIKATRSLDIDRMAGNLDALKLTANTDAGYTLAARKASGGRVLTYAAASVDTLQSAMKAGTPVTEEGATVYAVEQRLSLKPGKSGVAGLVCGWYAPEHKDLAGHVFGHKYEEWFADSGAVVEEVARDHDKLLSQTKKHFDVIATSTLPKWYKEMLQSNFYQGPAVTWLTKDGISFTYESADRCPAIGTMDVRYYGSFQKLAGFSELDNMEMRQFARVQHADGFIQHDLGVGRGLADVYNFPTDTTPVAPKPGKDEYQGYWVNLPIKFCLEAARNYQWTGDKAFLKEMWPHIKRAVTWIQARDYDDCGLPETFYSYDGWTMAGKAGYDANQWASMLVVVARMAKDMGEPQYATEMMATHDKALAQIQKCIWTGEYFRQGMLDGGSTNDMVSCLQVAGDWYGSMLGFESGVPDAQVKSALKVIDETCGKDSLYGVTVCVNRDGTPNGIWQCYVCGIGWSYYLASQYMYEGMDDISNRIAKELWVDYMVEKARVPWRQEEAIEDPHSASVTDRLLRDYRLGAIMTLAYSTAGLQMDIPAGKLVIRPADWVWKDPRMVLPMILPTWMGQIEVRRGFEFEAYRITNLDKPVGFRSLRLRTNAKGRVRVTVDGVTRHATVDKDGVVDAGAVVLDGETVIKIAAGS